MRGSKLQMASICLHAAQDDNVDLYSQIACHASTLLVIMQSLSAVGHSALPEARITL